MITRWLVRLAGLALAVSGLAAASRAEAEATDLYVQALQARPDAPPVGPTGADGAPVLTAAERVAWGPAVALRAAAYRRRLAGDLWRAVGFAGLALILAFELHRLTGGSGPPATGGGAASGGVVRRPNA